VARWSAFWTICSYNPRLVGGVLYGARQGARA
jgi:hypothetical protein